MKLVKRFNLKPRHLRVMVDVFWSGKYRKYIVAVGAGDVVELTPKQFEAVMRVLQILFEVIP